MTNLVYKNPPLDLVILKLDYSKIEDFEIKFISFIDNHFGITRFNLQKKEEDFPSIEIIMQNGQQSFRTHVDKQYRYYGGTDNSYCFCITSSSFSFEIKKHIGYNNILEDFNAVYNIIKDEIISHNRIGLRYINKINYNDDKELKSYISDNLIQHNKFNQAISKKGLSSTSFLNKSSFKNKKTVINFISGVPNINDKNFIIDLDSFATDFNVDIIDILTELHSNIITLFENSIKDTFREKIK